MRGRLDTLTRWLRLLLACLAVGAMVSPAQVASAVAPASVAQGGPGKKPAEAVTRAEVPGPRRALRVAALPASAWPATWMPPPASPQASSRPRFLLHRALLN
jgi:hypothetical protein